MKFKGVMHSEDGETWTITRQDYVIEYVKGKSEFVEDINLVGVKLKRIEEKR